MTRLSYVLSAAILAVGTLVVSDAMSNPPAEPAPRPAVLQTPIAFGVTPAAVETFQSAEPVDPAAVVSETVASD